MGPSSSTKSRRGRRRACSRGSSRLCGLHRSGGPWLPPCASTCSTRRRRTEHVRAREAGRPSRPPAALSSGATLEARGGRPFVGLARGGRRPRVRVSPRSSRAARRRRASGAPSVAVSWRPPAQSIVLTQLKFLELQISAGYSERLCRRRRPVTGSQGCEEAPTSRADGYSNSDVSDIAQNCGGSESPKGTDVPPGRSLRHPAGYKEGNFPCDRNARNGRTVCGPSTCALRYRT